MSGKKNGPKDADLANLEKALKRAVKTTRSLAEKTQTPCYVVKEGKIINVAERETAYRPAWGKSSEKWQGFDISEKGIREKYQGREETKKLEGASAPGYDGTAVRKNEVKTNVSIRPEWH